jgi:hypothetical protein
VQSEVRASGIPVQVVDVSRASRNVRWIRYGARIQVAIAIGFCVLSVDFVLTSIDPNVYSNQVPEERGLAVAVSVLALVNATTSLGLLTARPLAAVASLVFFGLPLVILAVAMEAMEAMSSETKLESLVSVPREGIASSSISHPYSRRTISRHGLLCRGSPNGASPASTQHTARPVRP